MKNYLSITAFVAAIIIGGALIWLGNSMPAKVAQSVLADTTLTVYRTETCGCCANYVDYLKRLGLSVEERVVEDIESIKHEHEIPHDLWSCHTTIAGDYVVEGHIPIEVMEKLFVEKPEIAGIAMPGMPSGSPGMGGSKQGLFEVFALAEDGSHSKWLDF